MYDCYDHIDSSVIYVEENIPGPAQKTEEYAEIFNTYNSQLTGHCECHNDCLQESCNCLQTYGNKYTTAIENHKVTYKLNYNKADSKTFNIVECNSLCSCKVTCGNRLVQKGPIDGLVIKMCESKNKGMGLFSKKVIEKGTFICEYAGEVITKDQALERHKSNEILSKMNYIYCLNEYSNGREMQTFIDPSKFGNIGRYINHSCDANCHIIPVRVDSPIPKLAIFSWKDILPDREITFDYGSNNLEVEDKTPDNISNRKECLCNSYNCKGLMPYNHY